MWTRLSSQQRCCMCCRRAVLLSIEETVAHRHCTSLLEAPQPQAKAQQALSGHAPQSGCKEDD